MRLASGILLLPSLLGWAAGCPPSAQVLVEIGLDVAGPGERVAVPVSLSTPAGCEAGAVHLTVGFSADRLAFQEVVAVSDGAGPRADVRVETLETNQEGARIRVILTPHRGGDGPSRELARLAFEISRNAQMNEDILLRILDLEVVSPQGEAVQSRGGDGLINVITGAFFSCFFYMH